MALSEGEAALPALTELDTTVFADVAHETILFARSLATQPLLGTDTWHTPVWFPQAQLSGKSNKGTRAHSWLHGSEKRRPNSLESVPPGDAGGVKMYPGFW